jgi:hypothetical protein
LRFDVLAQTANGTQILIEVKNDIEYIGRAKEQLDKYVRVTGIENAYVVVPQVSALQTSPGVLSVDSLIKTVKKIISNERLSKATTDSYRAAKLTPPDDLPTVFVAMPFADEFGTHFSLESVPLLLT